MSSTIPAKTATLFQRRLAGVWRRPGGISREAVLAEFARINDWTIAEPFGFDSLWRMRRVADDPLPRHRVLDHVTCLESGVIPLAVVSEPYSHIATEEIAAFAASMRVRAHEPPAAFASAHFPGNARFVVFTLDEPPRWLTEQADPFGEFAIHGSEIRCAS